MFSQDLIGTRLGQYEITGRLGEGGMGAVFRARQANLNREVALKILPGTLAAQPGYLARFEREARAVAALEHPAIVPIYDYGTENGITYLAIRLLDGGTLENRLEHSKTLPALDETANLIERLASALEYAHSRGIVHRDIKPSNVLFDHSGEPYLGDFGIAAVYANESAQTGTGQLVGTPNFIAPEVWSSQQVTPATDQYALAVMAFRLLTGRLPFEGTGVFDIGLKHINEPPPSASALRGELPRQVDVVLKQALAKQPDERYPSVREFASALKTALGGTVTGSVSKTGFFTAPLPTTAEEVEKKIEIRVGQAPSPRPAAPSVPMPSVRPAPSYAAQPSYAPAKRGGSPFLLIAGAVIVLLVIVFVILPLIGLQTGPREMFIFIVPVLIGVGGFTAVRWLSQRSSHRNNVVEERLGEFTPSDTITAAPIPTPQPVTPVTPVTLVEQPQIRPIFSLQEGEKLGRYELQKRLDKGEKSRVYHGFDSEMERDVAVKILSAADPRHTQRFQQEIRILSKLHHPHIIPFFDSGAESGLIYMVMPMLEGGTLKERMTGGPMSPAQVVSVVTHIAAALDYLHLKGIIHRDLKASNIMFDAHDNTYIVDFGIAKLTQDEGLNLTRAGDVVGTPYYIPPEQWIGDAITPASDQYSFAVMVFQMLTGRLPFEGKEGFGIEMMHKHVYDPAPFPSEFNPALPKAVDTVLLRALAKRPSSRYTSVTEFAIALQAAFAEQGATSAAVLATTGHVFISYSRTDQPYARKLADHINTHELIAWIDDQIDYGERWFREITKAIQDSAAVVVIMTPDAENSTWVEREILIAQRENKPILPLLLKGRGFAMFINIQYVDASGEVLPGDDFFTRLRRMMMDT